MRDNQQVKSEKILIYGASGHGKVIIDILETTDIREIVGILDDNEEKHGQNILGYPIVGGYDLLQSKSQYDDCKITLAIGDNHKRANLCSKLEQLGYNFASAIHPSASIGRNVTIGPGTVIMANAVINADTDIGSHVIINTAATIDHDCVIGDFAHVAPGANLAGGVHVSKLSFVGIGGSVAQNVEIGSGTTIGAGASVICDIPSNVIATGVPAKVIDKEGKG